MTAVSRSAGLCLLICVGLTACGGSGEDGGVIDVDYSDLKVAGSSETPLAYARSDEDILLPLRNGMRIAAGGGGIAFPAGALTPTLAAQVPYSSTTVQVDGVDEADAVKYDGRYIYAVRRELTPASGTAPQLSKNVLSIARTEPATAGIEHVSKYVIQGEQSTTPLLYQLLTPGRNADSLVAVSQNFHGWLQPQMPIAALVVQPDRTTVQLLDVSNPQNVTQTWQLAMDGWLRASRLIDDTLYVVVSYRPRMPDLILPADTVQKREANERRIRGSSARELLPGYAEDGGARRQLASTSGCLVAQQTASRDSYMDLTVIAAINMRSRRVTDVNCLSTNINGIYMSRSSLYVAGTGARMSESAPITVLHKFALNGGDIDYRATGAVTGTVSWSNPSYFMDEHEGDLRVVTSANGVHKLTVLRESGSRNLMLVSSLPNTTRPEPIGKPNEAVYAVRFMKERAYVVTFRMTDPLYVIDLRNPADPAIAGELEIPGFSTYLRPVGTTKSQLLLGVGQDVAADGRRGGVKVQLFDVRDIAHPQVIGEELFGEHGTSSEALDNPHAIAFLSLPGTGARVRAALPIQVYDTPHPTQPGRFNWTYSGQHLFEIAASGPGAPKLHFQGALRTQEPSDASPLPSPAFPNRAVLHGDSVFAIEGEQVVSSLWQDVPGG